MAQDATETEEIPEEDMADTDRQIGGKKGRRTREEHRVSGDKVISKIKELIHQGNVRRIIIKNEEGRSLIEVPLSVGVVGAVLAPMWAAIGAVAALVASCSIEVEREPDSEDGEDSEDSGDADDTDDAEA